MIFFIKNNVIIDFKNRNIQIKHNTIQMDKKETITKLAKKIKNVQFNINRLQQGKEVYNRNKIRRARKNKTKKSTEQPEKKKKILIKLYKQFLWKKRYNKNS